MVKGEGLSGQLLHTLLAPHLLPFLAALKVQASAWIMQGTIRVYSTTENSPM
jgi:hypothetical protein